MKVALPTSVMDVVKNAGAVSLEGAVSNTSTTGLATGIVVYLIGC